MATEVHPSTSTETGVEKPGLPKPGDKKGGKWAKYKWWIIGGGIVIVLLVFYFVHKSSSSSSTQAGSANSDSNTDPSTGYPYGSAADLAALGASGTSTGGVPGPAGPTGPSGATGAIGATGTPGKSDPFHSRWYGGKNAKDDLQKLAESYGMTEASLVALNPSLKKYEGTGKPPPKRVRITV
jgi:hypothetical protein